MFPPRSQFKFKQPGSSDPDAGTAAQAVSPPFTDNDNPGDDYQAQPEDYQNQPQQGSMSRNAQPMPNKTSTVNDHSNKSIPSGKDAKHNYPLHHPAPKNPQQKASRKDMQVWGNKK